MKRIVILFACILTVLTMKQAAAAPFDTGYKSYTQPNQTTTFNARKWGDEFICYFETENGYQIVQDEYGWYCYAQLDGNGFYEPSSYKVGIDDPINAGIEKHQLMSTSAYDSIMCERLDFHDELVDTVYVFKIFWTHLRIC